MMGGMRDSNWAILLFKIRRVNVRKQRGRIDNFNLSSNSERKNARLIEHEISS